MPDELEKEARIELQVDVWKTIIEVQQHFNDIELKVRGLALTVITAVLGAVALAAKDGTTVLLLGVHWKLATIVILVGAVIWRTFYQVDQIWYHRLLLGAVKQGIDIEKRLKAEVPGIELSQTIGAESPYWMERVGGRLGGWLRKKWPNKTRWTHRELHSTDKLRRFYRTVGALLLTVGLVVQLGDVKTVSQAKPDTTPTTATVTTSSTPALTVPSMTVDPSTSPISKSTFATTSVVGPSGTPPAP